MPPHGASISYTAASLVSQQPSQRFLDVASCSDSDVKFFFGEHPSSFDAVLYPHLLFHYRSPVAAPELRRQVGIAD